MHQRDSKPGLQQNGLQQNGLQCDQLRIFRVASVAMAFTHIWSQLKIYKQEGRDVILASARDNFFPKIKELGLQHKELNIYRQISPLQDVIGICQLIKLIRKSRPHILHSSTPKAGLICAIAGVVAKVPVRIHTFTGQRWATLKGIRRWLLKKIDTLISCLNTKVYSDSPSQNQFLIEQGIVKREKIACLHKGSLGGIDLEYFNRSHIGPRDEILSDYEIPLDTTILLYLGRINKDKGINELVEAFANFNKKAVVPVYLLLVGPYENKLDPLENRTLQFIQNTKNIKMLESTLTPEKFYSVADIFCLPSYREGFGTVILEASAYGIPSIGTRIPGLIDAIEDNMTGILVEPGNILALEMALEKMIYQPDLRKKLGSAAYERVIRDFDHNFMAKKQWEEYQSLFDQIQGNKVNS